MKLHIGCGKKYMKGWVNIDVNPRLKTDLCIDVDKGLPFDDSSVTEVKMHHSLEHVKGYLQFIEELYRVCTKDALWHITVPYVTSSHMNMVNPYHHTHFNEFSFDFFNPKKLRGSAHEMNSAKLNVVSFDLTYFPESRHLTKEEKEFARRHYWNVVSQVHFKIKVIK